LKTEVALKLTGKYQNTHLKESIPAMTEGHCQLTPYCLSQCLRHVRMPKHFQQESGLGPT